MSRGGKFPDEVAAIEAIRNRNSKTPQRVLARQIAARNFSDYSNPEDRTAAARLIGRSELSIYSVIRRYDKRINALVQNALATV